MAKQSKRKPKAKLAEIEQARKRDAMALAQLIYDIWKEKKHNGKAK